jgi:imidazolonepropionase-like amidohydrolase
MKKLTIVAISIFTALSLIAQKKDGLLIKNVTVINVSNGRVYKDVDAKLENSGIIVSKTKGKAPKNAIDGTGKYLMAALNDMHVHFPDQNEGRFMQLLTATGIANCRVMKSNEKTLTYAAKYQNTKIWVSYNIFGKDSFGLADIPAKIAQVKKDGYAFIKIFGLKDAAYFEPIMAAAKKHNLVVCGHAISNVPAKQVLASGYKTVEHVGYFDAAKTLEALDSLLDIAAKNKVAICPTLDWSMMVYHTVPKDSLPLRAGYEIGKKLYAVEWDTTYDATTKQLKGNEERYAKYFTDLLTKKLDILQKAHKKGITIIAGSDAEEPYQTPGYSLIEELKWIQKAGFSNLELLQMVTKNATELLTTINGNVALPNSYVLLEKNPLENINNLATVTLLINKTEVIDCKKLLSSIQ